MSEQEAIAVFNEVLKSLQGLASAVNALEKRITALENETKAPVMGFYYTGDGL